MNPKQPIYFPALTGIRAIAAYFVFIHHYDFFSIPIQSRILKAFFSELHIGVTIFFVLSGFLITYRYYGTDKIDFKKYMVNRFARIYPMYFLLTTITFVFIFRRFDFGFALQVYIMNITFLRGLFSDLLFTGVSQGWSLTVEEMFYLSAPIIFILVKKNKYWITIFPILLISIGILMTLISQSVHSTFMGSFEFMFNYTFFGRCTEFFVGIALGILILKSKQMDHKGLFTYIGIVVILVSVFGLACLSSNHGIDYGIRHPFGKLINTVILPIFGIAPLLYGLLTEKTLVCKFLSSKTMVLLGKSSYIFYLIHFGEIEKHIQMFTKNNLVLFVLLNIISVLMFRFLEEPLNLKIRKYFASK